VVRLINRLRHGLCDQRRPKGRLYGGFFAGQTRSQRLSRAIRWWWEAARPWVLAFTAQYHWPPWTSPCSTAPRSWSGSAPFGQPAGVAVPRHHNMHSALLRRALGGPTSVLSGGRAVDAARPCFAIRAINEDRWSATRRRTQRCSIPPQQGFCRRDHGGATPYGLAEFRYRSSATAKVLLANVGDLFNVGAERERCVARYAPLIQSGGHIILQCGHRSIARAFCGPTARRAAATRTSVC